MHDKPIARQAAYYLFSSRERTWALTAFSVINLFGAVRNVVSPNGGLHFYDARFRTYAYVMEVVSAVVLSYCIARAGNKPERAFIALWLVGWAILWFRPAFCDPVLPAVRYTSVVVWAAATVIALGITRAWRKHSRVSGGVTPLIPFRFRHLFGLRPNL